MGTTTLGENKQEENRGSGEMEGNSTAKPKTNEQGSRIEGKTVDSSSARPFHGTNEREATEILRLGESNRENRDESEEKDMGTNSLEGHSSTPTFGELSNRRSREGAFACERISIRPTNEKEKDGEEDKRSSTTSNESITDDGSAFPRGGGLSTKQLDEIRKEAEALVTEQLRAITEASAREREEEKERIREAEAKKRAEEEAQRAEEERKRKEEEKRLAAIEMEKERQRIFEETVRATLAQVSGKLSGNQQKLLNKSLSSVLENDSPTSKLLRKDDELSSTVVEIDKVRVDSYS